MSEPKEWVTTQAKAFTKWINQHLKNSSLQVKNIFTDLSDGLILIKLLETLAQQSVCK